MKDNGLTITRRAIALFAELEKLILADKVETINEIRLALREHSPFKTEPVDCVQWVLNTQVTAKITKPDNHTWKSFCNLLLGTLPENTRNHYITKFKVFIKWWKARGYPDGIPEESPPHLESQKIAPSWRRLCKVLLRNDYWCKGLAFTQPKSAAYGRYLELKKNKALLKAPRTTEEECEG